jgi:pyrimidine deaminase RibD-like protein
MARAIELAHLCPVENKFGVGAVIVDADGHELAKGYSRENDPHDHAEEGALAKLPANDPRLATATIYSTMEPCSERSTPGRVPCSELIIAAGIPRVVIAYREPLTFVDCVGVEKLHAAGVQVIELPEFAEAAVAMNRHLDLSR